MYLLAYFTLTFHCSNKLQQMISLFRRDFHFQLSLDQSLSIVSLALYAFLTYLAMVQLKSILSLSFSLHLFLSPLFTFKLALAPFRRCRCSTTISKVSWSCCAIAFCCLPFDRRYGTKTKTFILFGVSRFENQSKANQRTVPSNLFFPLVIRTNGSVSDLFFFIFARRAIFHFLSSHPFIFDPKVLGLFKCIYLSIYRLVYICSVYVFFFVYARALCIRVHQHEAMTAIFSFIIFRTFRIALNLI